MISYSARPLLVGCQCGQLGKGIVDIDKYAFSRDF